jgi:glycosyltransferase involved in cell wall biosynthesis
MLPVTRSLKNLRVITDNYMEYPKISIVTPSFNQAEFLEQTIRSVLDQNYPNLEYVVIDGGSTDGSADIIKKYADKLTYWVSEKDKGQYDAINKGFSHTTGEIMGWINSSDIYYPWTLHILAAIFGSTEKVEWISGMHTNLSTGTAPQSIDFARQKNIYDIVGGKYKWLQQESIFWKRSLWIKAGGKLDLDVGYAGDLNLWLKFFSHTQLYYVNTILGGFRYHDVRRGNNTYEMEAEKLFKDFRSQQPFKIKRRAFVMKTFISQNNFLRRVFKKLKVIDWYRHYNVYFDFNENKWMTRIH